MKAPCKNCTRRVVGCHVTCKEYIMFRKLKDEVNAGRALEVKARRDADDLRAEGIKNVTHGRKRL